MPTRSNGSCIREENFLQVRDNYDVIVAGGGVAGAAAAIAARRLGAKTLLLEKSGVPGGLATSGLVAVYLPLCDGRGRQVTAGIAEEFLLLSGKYGFDTLPDFWKGNREVEQTGRYCTNFSPAAFAIALDELMEREGVDLSYDTLVCRPALEGKRCTHIVVENKSAGTHTAAGWRSMQPGTRTCSVTAMCAAKRGITA
jgi:flavin-dependent dehydrogenase